MSVIVPVPAPHEEASIMNISQFVMDVPKPNPYQPGHGAVISNSTEVEEANLDLIEME